nr:MAG TPA: hypothetical protein [Caudoviricetes sp.]
MVLRKICAQKNHTEVWYNICVTRVNINCCKKSRPCYAGRLFLLTQL